VEIKGRAVDVHQICQFPHCDFLDAFLLEQGSQSVQDQSLCAAVPPFLFDIICHDTSSFI
jgi:hypothetical protein